MREQGEGGFTIIEVTIFLAITALMVSIAVAGVGSRISSTRFNDSVRSFESFMQRQFDETLNGVNARSGNETCKANAVIDPSSSSTPGASNDCLLLGKFIYFSNGSSRVKVYQVVGSDPTNLSDGDGDLQAIEKSKPHLVQSVAVEAYDIPWQAEVYDTRRDDGTPSGTGINSVAMIRSPKSSSIYTYTFNVPGNPDTMSANLTSFLSAPASVGKQTNICIRSQDIVPTYGAISISRSGRGQDSISSRLDITDSNRAGLCEGA